MLVIFMSPPHLEYSRSFGAASCSLNLAQVSVQKTDQGSKVSTCGLIIVLINSQLY
jgi:hypothetical protein